MRHEILELVARVAMTDPAGIQAQTLLSDLSWDSMAQLEFMAACDEELGLVIDSDSLSQASSVGDLIEIAQQKR